VVFFRLPAAAPAGLIRRNFFGLAGVAAPCIARAGLIDLPLDQRATSAVSRGPFNSGAGALQDSGRTTAESEEGERVEC
jgi:hypothetical protein